MFQIIDFFQVLRFKTHTPLSSLHQVHLAPPTLQKSQQTSRQRTLTYFLSFVLFPFHCIDELILHHGLKSPTTTSCSISISLTWLLIKVWNNWITSGSYLLLQLHHFGLGVVQSLVSDLDVSPLVFGGGAQRRQLHLQLLLLTQRLFV